MCLLFKRPEGYCAPRAATFVGKCPGGGTNMAASPFRKAVIYVLTITGAVALYTAYRISKLPLNKPAAVVSHSRRQFLSGQERTSDDRYLALLKRYLVRYDFGPSYRVVNFESSSA